MQINKEQLAIELLDRIYVEASNIQNHLLEYHIGGTEQVTKYKAVINFGLKTDVV